MPNQITRLNPREEKKNTRTTGMDSQTEKLMLEVMKQEDIAAARAGDRSSPGHMFPAHSNLLPDYTRKKFKTKICSKKVDTRGRTFARDKILSRS